MLPPGHIAAGYLTGYAVTEILKPQVTQHQRNILIALSAFFSFVPDLDIFITFWKVRAFSFGKRGFSDHRYSPVHKPILWFVVGLLIYFSASSVFYKYIGLMLWLGSWSHFVLDSLDYGITWLWPFNNKYYSIRNKALPFLNNEENFVVYWWKWLSLHYYPKFWLTAFTEIALLVFALLLLIKK